MRAALLLAIAVSLGARRGERSVYLDLSIERPLWKAAP